VAPTSRWQVPSCHYSTKCLEEAFCELLLYGILRDPIVTEQVIVSVLAAIDPWHRAAVLVTIICASTTGAEQNLQTIYGESGACCN
jgi:hypothetical protein